MHIAYYQHYTNRIVVKKLRVVNFSG